jgi:hypothetical protein
LEVIKFKKIGLFLSFFHIKDGIKEELKMNHKKGKDGREAGWRGSAEKRKSWWRQKRERGKEK